MPTSLDPLSPPERERLRVLDQYRVVDTPAEASFDKIVADAAKLAGVSAAALTLVTADRCWFKSQVGLGVTEVPRSFGLCGYAYCSSGTLVIEDAANTPPFHQVPLVTEAGFRFYIGVPLINSEGHSLGTLCVLDRTPRQPTQAQITGLQDIAREALVLLEARRSSLRSAPPVANTPPPRARRHVLVVDDEESIRSFVCSVFRFRGITAFPAANGTEALALYRENAETVGLVFTDIHMPGMSGLELIEALRLTALPPAVAVMTGRLDYALQRMLEAMNVPCVLAKPFALADFDRLLTLLPAPAPADSASLAHTP